MLYQLPINNVMCLKSYSINNIWSYLYVYFYHTNFEFLLLQITLKLLLESPQKITTGHSNNGDYT